MNYHLLMAQGAMYRMSGMVTMARMAFANAEHEAGTVEEALRARQELTRLDAGMERLKKAVEEGL